ncbi:MAG: MBL fold metallo-hydrolase [Clostridia bacterium]|nr:MBL fold metallo-hydrolase [Clostridia bacterium]
MQMILCPLASGSSGNVTLVSLDGVHLLVDLGVSAGRVVREMHELSLSPQDLSGILITHEHVDHIRGLDVFLRKNPVPVFANAAAQEAIVNRFPSVPAGVFQTFETGQDF